MKKKKYFRLLHLQNVRKIVQGCQIAVAAPEIRMPTGTEVFLPALQLQGEAQSQRHETYVGRSQWFSEFIEHWV